MSKLLKVQDQFVDAIYDENSKGALKFVKSDNIAKEKLIEIYREGVYETLLNCLRLTYPRVFDFLGKEKSREFSYEFIAKNRSKSANLDHYGEEFGEFLLQKGEDFLANLAKIEWCHQLAFLAKGSDFLDLEKLQNLSEEEICDVKFDLSPSFYVVESDYNLFAKRKQSKKTKRVNYFIIYRFDLDVREDKISKSEFNFLSGVKEGLSFYEICEKYNLEIGPVLQKFVANKVLSGFA